MQNKTLKFIVNAAVIAALYAALTLLLAPMSFGLIQVRVSEALTVLSMFMPAAVPGITLGCFISNIVGPNGIMDAIFGSLASLIGCLLMYKFRSKPLLAPLFCVFSNGIIVGLMIHFVYGEALPWPLCILLVSAEEAVSVYILGVPVARAIRNSQMI